MASVFNTKHSCGSKSSVQTIIPSCNQLPTAKILVRRTSQPEIRVQAYYASQPDGRGRGPQQGQPSDYDQGPSYQPASAASAATPWYNRQFMFCGLPFSFKTLRGYVATRMHSYQSGEQLDAMDEVMLMELLKCHHTAAQKIGCGVSHFTVGMTDKGTVCFWLHRKDGTSEDFSYIKCLAAYAYMHLTEQVDGEGNPTAPIPEYKHLQQLFLPNIARALQSQQAGVAPNEYQQGHQGGYGNAQSGQQRYGGYGRDQRYGQGGYQQGERQSRFQQPVEYPFAADEPIGSQAPVWPPRPESFDDQAPMWPPRPADIAEPMQAQGVQHQQRRAPMHSSEAASGRSFPPQRKQQQPPGYVNDQDFDDIDFGAISASTGSDWSDLDVPATPPASPRAASAPVASRLPPQQQASVGVPGRPGPMPGRASTRPVEDLVSEDQDVTLQQEQAGAVRTQPSAAQTKPAGTKTRPAAAPAAAPASASDTQDDALPWTEYFAALKLAVRAQLKKSKDSRVAGAGSFQCERTGKTVAAADAAVVYHPDVPFKKLLAAWMKQEGMKDRNQIQLAYKPGSSYATMADQDQRQSWMKFHEKYARLQLVSKAVAKAK